MEQFLETLSKYHLDPIMVVIYIASGFFCKTYLKKFKYITVAKRKIEIDTAWKTLALGTLFIGIYTALLSASDQLPKEAYIKTFYSYVVATSFYEILIKPVQRFIAFITGGKQEDTTK